jgi:septal ring factor EnvC (AmiA/AmiB activator)
LWFGGKKVRRRPVSKKLIILAAAAGLISFGGSFVLGWLTKPAAARGEPNQPAYAGETQFEPAQQIIGGESSVKTAMTQKQLEDLIAQVREKMQEYNSKLEGLQAREQRLLMAQDSLKKDIGNLDNLRTELASTIASVKDERDKLQKGRLEIAQAEKANLISIAAAYDRMDASSASKILVNMCQASGPQKEAGDIKRVGSNFDDAVKILNYMSERTKAKVLGEIVNSEPKLAAALCERLKQIAEGK